jgi:nitroimidazol reductase NimA-like FMN-containing flavoprotein (pyridoxamine 5'-phosphate oxidase superfamily)
VDASAKIVLEELSEDECLQLLSDAHVGRLAVVEDGQPLVVPVNFTYTPDGLVVRTDVGTKLEAGGRHLVAFEIDEIDQQSHLGWSVLVQGHGYDVTDTLDEKSGRLRSTLVDTWAPGEKARRMRIDLSKITGRRLRVAAEDEALEAPSP